MGFDGSSITGFNPIEESDMIAMPDPATFAVLPWRAEENATGAHVLRRPGFPAASRTRATRAGSCAGPSSARRTWASTPTTSARSSSTSTSRTRGPEGGMPETLDEGGYFDLTTLDAGSDVRRETILALEQLGIHVEYAHHEVGPSQHEVDMRYKDALAMSDDCMTYRIVVKEYAMKLRLARDLHAEAALRRERLRHARPPVAVEGRQERLLRPGRQVLPLGHGEGVHRGPAPARPRDRAALRAVGQLLQAPGAGLRGAGLPRPGRGATARP